MKRAIPARRRTTRIPRPPSRLEEHLASDMHWYGLPAPVREHRFAAPERQWRFDFAWPDLGIAAEVEGGTHVGGRHTRGTGFAADCEKYNAAALRGWRVFRFTGDMVRNGMAIDVIEEAIAVATSMQRAEK